MSPGHVTHILSFTQYHKGDPYLPQIGYDTTLQDFGRLVICSLDLL